MKTDLKKYRNILKQEGTARIERYLADLDPASVVMDDRSLASLLLYAQKYYDNVRFMPVNDNNFNQSWDAFFKNDVIFILTKIASKNAQHIREAFDLLYKQYDESKNAETIIELTQYIYQRFQKIKEWLGFTAAHELLHNDLKIFIEAYLSKKAQDFYAVTSLQRWNDKKGKELQELVATLIDESIWGTKHDFEAAAKDVFIDGADEVERSAKTAVKLNDIFDTLYYVTDATITNANNYFKQILQGEKNHAPQIALLVAFLKMFEFLQEDFNKLPQKHLDYYYSQMLGIQKGKAVADRAYVYFQMAKGFDSYMIEKGTLLSAGKDKKNVEQWYSVDKDVMVSKANITSIKTMLIDRGSIRTGEDKDKPVIKAIYTNELQKDDAGGFEPTPWNTFGDINDYRSDIGFAIASPQLFLSQGDRTVTINFETAENIKEQEFDLSLIKILLTGEKKWLDSNNQQDGVSINYLKTEGSQNLALSFTVSIAQPSAITAFNAAIHGNIFQGTSPVLQCLLQYPILNEGDEYYYNTLLQQLDDLQKLKTTSFSIKVEVGSFQGVSFNGMRNVAVQNHEAELNSSKPFYPFTGAPKVGSSFYMSSDELEEKKVKKMAINIDWMLPPNFKTYYDNYFAPYNSNKFVVALSQLKDNCWKRISETSVIDVDSFDPRFRAIRIDFDKPASEESTDVAKADFSKAEGTIRMKLQYPDFGHSIYPQLITSSAMSKSGDKKSVENYSKILKKHLHDSVIMILLPDDMEDREGSLKAVHDIIERIQDDAQAGNMLVKALNLIIRKYNGSNVILKRETPDEEQPTVIADAGNREVVNDDNLIERILNLGRRLRLIKKDVHYDRDKQTVGDVAESINEELVTTASFILPSESELVALIMNETNIAIGKTVVKVAGELINQRKSSITPGDTDKIIKKEFSESNEVINDIIAEKIAALLLANEVPPTPYTPLINSISISYVAESAYDSTKDSMYQVTPFGVVETAPYFEEMDSEENNKTARSYIFPQNGVYKGSSAFIPAGMFFIGIKDVVKDHNISMLFQFAEGTRKTENVPPKISWHYLASDNWVPFKNEDIVFDNTYGLQTTGIIEFAMPEKITNENTLINQPQTFWIAAMVQDDPAAFPMLLDIAPHAGTATFKDEGNDPSHYELPLPALKITKLVDAVAAIKKVVQPLASFNGKVPEQGKEYYARVSERLRHKARALTVWDYEHLILANFPPVFKVKCLNNYYNGNFAVGHVTIVPVCDLRNNDASNIDLLFPRASYVLLTSIKKFLAARTSPFVKIHVINPVLDRILISCKVKFKRGVDKGFYLKQLNADIVRFLTPWANNDIKMLSFSSKVYRSSVTNFIDKRPYVDYVTDVEMFQYVEKDHSFYKLPNGTISLKETAFTTPHSILVSEQEHTIKLIE